MIKHYAVIAGHVDDNGEIVYEIDHAAALSKLGGVAFDTDINKWLTPSKLETVDLDGNDVKFVQGILQKLVQEVDDFTIL